MTVCATVSGLSMGTSYTSVTSMITSMLSEPPSAVGGGYRHGVGGFGLEVERCPSTQLTGNRIDGEGSPIDASEGVSQRVLIRIGSCYRGADVLARLRVLGYGAGSAVPFREHWAGCSLSRGRHCRCCLRFG